MKKPEFGWSMGFPFWAWLSLASALIQGCSSPPLEPPVHSEFPPPSSRAAVATSEAAAIKMITVGERVTVSFSGVEPALPIHEERVKADGTITLPMIGAIIATNQTAGEIAKEIQRRFVPQFYRTLGVVVHLDPFYYVSVQGDPNSPHRLPWSREISVTEAAQNAPGMPFAIHRTVSAAGPRFQTPTGRLNVDLIRADGVVLPVDLERGFRHPERDPKILPGDTVRVTRRRE